MTADQYPRYFPLGDSAVTVEFGDKISEESNRRAITLADRLEEEPFPGYVESIPAYASTTIFYRPAEVSRAFRDDQSSYDAVLRILKGAISECNVTGEILCKSEPVIFPVDFSEDVGMDLKYVATRAKMTVKEVISLFLSRTYRVYMLGFLPGFPYMGEVDERIATSRKETPRTLVCGGSVGIAGRQTGIYPFDSPGGWQVIGRTDVEIFRPHACVPCLLKPGDRVKFIQK